MKGVLRLLRPPPLGAIAPEAPGPGLALEPVPATAEISVTVRTPPPLFLSAAPRADGTDAMQVLRVPDEFVTIAAAIHAAPNRAVIRIAPGTYRERLTVKRSVTLVGAGTGATILEGTRGLDRILAFETPAAAVRVESLTFRASTTDHPDRPAGVVVRGARAVVEDCTFEGLGVAIHLDGAPVTAVRANLFRGNDVAIRIGGGTPRVTFNLIRGPGSFGVQAAGSDAVVALNVFVGLEAAAAFGGAGAEPMFVSNTVVDSSRVGVFADAGTSLVVQNTLFAGVDAAVIVADRLAAASNNLFWGCAMGAYMRDPSRSGALFPIDPAPGAADRHADPMLTETELRPRGGSPAFAGGVLAPLESAGVSGYLPRPRGAPPIGALGFPAGVPVPGRGIVGEPEGAPAPTTVRDLRLLLEHVEDDCGGHFVATEASAGGLLSVRCERCGRASVFPFRLRPRPPA